MSLLGGMTTDGTFVVIEGSGPRWRIWNHVNATPDFWRGRATIERPAFPVVLDHHAWTSEGALADALLRAKWDILPPRREGGKAAPAREMDRRDLGGAIYNNLMEDVPKTFHEALALACWGITHLGEDDGDSPIASLPFASCSVNRPAKCSNCHGLVEGSDCPACGPP